MNAWLRNRLRDRAVDERGFTLVEVIVVMVLLTLVTGGLAASFTTALHVTQTNTERVKESNDAQIAAAFLVRDAQSAGGSNVTTGATDPTLGVSLTDNAGCTGAGNLVIRFTWVDHVTNTVAHTRVTGYYFDASSSTLTRVSCTDGSAGAPVTLASHVTATPAPTAACHPTSACPGLPDTVDLTVTELNVPVNASTPYSYTLSAKVRPDAQSAPSDNDSPTVPFLLLANGNTCPAGGSLAMSAQGGGNSKLRVYGTAVIDGYQAGCPDVTFGDRSIDYIASGGTAVLAPGASTCQGMTCTQFTTPIPDPYANLTPPSDTCGAGTNPAPVAGVYQPGTYPQALSVSGTASLKSGGTFVFCNGLTVGGTLSGTNVLLYFKGGSLTVTGTLNVSAPTTGSYPGLVVWQRTGNATPFQMCCNNNAVANFNGVTYVPSAVVTLHNGSLWFKALIALAVSWDGGGNGGTTIGSIPPALTVTGPSSLPTGTKGQTYPGTTFTASGGAGGYTWSATGLPNGLLLDPATGNLSGTPNASGTFSVTATVTDLFLATKSRTYTLTINPALTITTTSLPNWTQGRPYPSTTVNATGGSGGYSWSAMGLPIGLSIDASTGVISGTPTTVGATTPTITVTDSSSNAVAKTFGATINPPPSITTPSLSNAAQGAAYSQTVTSSGGTPSLTWSATGLPSGLAINPNTGTIAGTTTATGTFTVGVTVNDAANASATKSYSLTVSSTPLTVSNVTLGNANGQVAKGDTVSIVFNKAIAVASMCSTWSGNTADQSITGNGQVTVTVNNNAGATGNDTLTVSSSTCALKFGTIDLGSPNWVTATTSYSGNGGNASAVNYTASTFTLVVTLGSGNSGGGGVAAQTVTYTPNTSVTDTFGNAISGSYQFASRRF